MSTKKLPTSRRTFVKGTAATAAIAPFFIGRSAKAGDSVKMKVATAAPDGTPWARLAKSFGKLLKKNTDGQVSARTYFSSQLGDEGSTLKACLDGRIHAWAGSMGAASEIVSELGVFELPYLFKSSKAAQKALSANRTMLHDILWDSGFKLVMFAENGFQHLGTKFPVDTPSDLKGRKIRTQESKIHIGTVNAWGASAVPMSITEVLSSLQTNVIEGLGQSAIFTQAAGISSALTHWTKTHHIYQPALILLSKKGLWDKLSPEMQAALALDSDDIRKLENRHGFNSVRNLVPQLNQNFVDMGLTVHEPDTGPWEKLAGSVHNDFRKRTTKKGVALLDSVKKSL